MRDRSSAARGRGPVREGGIGPAGARVGVAIAVLALVGASACRSPNPLRYRLTESGTHWDVARGDPVFADLQPRYPEFFDPLVDPGFQGDLDLRRVRLDLERRPVDRRNYDALNAVAIGYFELNYRAESLRGDFSYLRASIRAAHLLAIPWRAYGEIEEPALREAILDFFEDAGRGEKLATAATAPRLTRVVASLEKKEADPGRRARIRSLVEHLTRLEREAQAQPPD